MILDSHHHFWHYTPEEFGWIGPEMAGLRRDFLPRQLANHLEAHGIGGTIAVQARQSEVETRWLLELATAHGFVRGVVGWLPLTADDLEEKRQQLGPAENLVGLRHVLQGEPAGYMERPDFNRGVSRLLRMELSYDLLVTEEQLPAAIALVDRQREQRFILDHLGKPGLRDPGREPWRTHLRELARRPNVWCKLSGGITESDLAWTPSQLRPYFDDALDAFGPARLIFGSNWPVCDAAGGYSRWLAAVVDWASPLSAAERSQIFAGAAEAAYRLKPLGRPT